MGNYGARGEKAENLFNLRVAAYESLFSKTRSELRSHLLEECGLVAANAVSTVKINRSKLRQAVDRYINDLIRLKEMHIDVANAFQESEKNLHRSKIAAYTLKWLLHEHPAYYVIELEDYDSLPNYAKGFLDDINIIFSLNVVFYHLDFLNGERVNFSIGGKYARVYHDLIYYIKTDAYSEKMASLLFDAMYANSAEGISERGRGELIR
jgi:hypothetical protein